MDFSMQVANPEEVKKGGGAAGRDTAGRIGQANKSRANKNAEALMAIDLDTLADKRSVVQSIESFGNEAMQKVLTEKLTAKSYGGASSPRRAGDGGVVSKSLLDLHREIKDLDPSLVDFAKTGFLGTIFNPIRAYFQKYEKAERTSSQTSWNPWTMDGPCS